MRRITIIFISLILFSTLQAQTIVLQTNLGYSNHYANIDEGEQLDEPKVPSIGCFFEDGFIFETDLNFSFQNMKENNNSFFVGFLYEHSKINSKNKINSILGNYINLNNYGFLIGYWIKPFDDNKNLILYTEANYLFKSYSGISNLEDNYLIKSKYSNAKSTRLGLGMRSITFFNLPVSVGILLSYELGTVRRDTIEIYKNDTKIGKLIPSGDIVLPDNIFSLKFSIAYLLNL